MHLDCTTYQQLYEVIDHWQNGIYDIVIIEGFPGSGKSFAIKQAMENTNESYLWVDGRITAAKMYQELYNFVDCPVIFDDTDSLVCEKQCTNLLKTLCQSNVEAKRVSWNTTRKLPQGIPTVFATSSTVILITNEWKKLSPHLAAVQDRGLHLLFHPSPEELHQYAMRCCDSEVHTYIGLFIHRIINLSLRHYVIAQRMADQHLDWRRLSMQSWGLDPLHVVYIQLELDYPTMVESERQAKFHALTGKPYKTYSRIKAELMAQ